MPHVINEALYIKTKAKLDRGFKLPTVIKTSGLSNSSVQRIKKSKDYTDFKRILVKDRGPMYGLGAVWSTRDTSSSEISLRPEKGIQKRSNFLSRLFRSRS